jgi:hypothetical protein
VVQSAPFISDCVERMKDAAFKLDVFDQKTNSQKLAVLKWRDR